MMICCWCGLELKNLPDVKVRKCSFCNGKKGLKDYFKKQKTHNCKPKRRRIERRKLSKLEVNHLRNFANKFVPDFDVNNEIDRTLDYHENYKNVLKKIRPAISIEEMIDLGLIDVESELEKYHEFLVRG